MAIPTHKIIFTDKYGTNIPLRLYPSPQSPVVGYTSPEIKQEDDGGAIGFIMVPNEVSLAREWVLGAGPAGADYNLIKISPLSEAYEENSIEAEGGFYYVPTETVQVLSTYKPQELEKKQISLQELSPMAQVLKPEWTKLESPYYDRQYGDYWVTVKLPYTCLSDGLTSEMKKEASIAAITKIYEHFNVQKSGEYGIEYFANGILATKLMDWYISTRPNSKVKVFVKIPAIYVEFLKSLPNNETANIQDDADGEVVNWAELEIKIPINSIDSSIDRAVECLKDYYQQYITCDFIVKKFNFEKEIKALKDTKSKIKFLLNENGINFADSKIDSLGSCSKNASSGGLLTIRFKQDFTINSAHYSSEKSDKGVIVLDKSLREVRNTYPFNRRRTNLLFLKHRELCNPSLSLLDFLQAYVIDPAVTIEWNQKNAPSDKVKNKQISEYGQLDLNLSPLDLQSSLKNISLKLNSSLGINPNLDVGGFGFNNMSFDFGGFPASRKMNFKLEAVKFRDSMTINSGDMFSSPDLLDSLRWRLRFGGLDDLYNYVLKFIDFGKLFNSLGSHYASSAALSLGDLSAPDFGGLGGTPDFGSVAFPSFDGSMGIPPGGEFFASNPLLNAQGLDLSGPEWQAAFGDLTGIDFGSFGDSLYGGDLGLDSSFPNIKTSALTSPDSSFDFNFEIPSFTLRIPTFNLLDTLASVLIELFEILLAQIILELILYLLESLMEKNQSSQIHGCPDEIGKLNPNTSADVAVLKNYGGENVNNLLKDSIGVYEEEIYNSRIGNIFQNCGIPVQGIGGETPPENNLTEEDVSISPSTATLYLESISEMISPFELLSLFNGNATYDLLTEILEYTEDNYEKIYYYLDTTSKLESFFVCIGENLSENVIQQVQDDIVEAYKNPELCVDIVQELKSQMKEKCPSPESVAKSVYKELYDSANKYKRIVNILQNSKGENCENVPSLFNDGQTKGALSSQKFKPKSQDFFISKVSQTLISPAKVFTQIEMNQFFNEKYGNKFDTLLTALKGDNLVGDGNFFKASQFSQDIGLAFSPVGSANPAIFANTPEIYMYEDGKMSLSNILVNNQPVQSLSMTNSPYAIGESIQSSINSSSKLQSIKANSEYTITKQQAIFYELIKKYYKQKYSSNAESLAYFLHKDDYETFLLTSSFKNLYHNIFSEMVENMLEAVGNRWTASNAQATLQQYSNNISNIAKLNQIIQYDKAKELISSNYDLGDFDNPNDQTIGKKQYALLSGALHVYFRTYILEFLCRSMPFFDVFGIDLSDSEKQFKFASKYIKQMIRVDLGEGEMSSFIQASDLLQESLGIESMPMSTVLNYEDFFPLCEQVVQFLREKEVITAKQISSIDKSNSDWAVEFYISTNFDSVYNLFANEILVLPENANAAPIDIQSVFGYGVKPSDPQPLPAHAVGGFKYSFEEEDYSVGPSIGNLMWGGASGPGKDLSDKDYSLFGLPTSTFTRGGFFIQNYFYITEGGTKSTPAFESRSPHERGVVSKDVLFDLIAEVVKANLSDPNGPNADYYSGKMPDLADESKEAGYDLSLSSLFSNIKMGSRLCYGVYHNGNDLDNNNATNRVANNCARAIFDAYDSGTTINQVNINSTQRQAGRYIAELDKSIVCPDGPNPNFQGGPLNFSLTNKNVQAPGVLGKSLQSYSVVVPFCSVEAEVPMSTVMTYLISEYGYQYEEGIDLETEFKNLNSAIFNTDEYKALRNACFPMEDILMYISVFGLQTLSYNNIPLQTALVGTKINLISAIKAIENGKKWDYLQE